MDIQSLRQMGLVNSNALTRTDVKIKYRPLLPKEQWADAAIEERQQEEVEGVVTVFLRRLTAADQLAIANVDKKVGDPVCMMIHRTVFMEDGQRLFPTADDVLGLDLTMFAGLVTAIVAHNPTAKKVPPRMSSGVSSHSHSADEPLLNGKTPSAPLNLQSGPTTAESSAH
jgi:hypothetical protein